jgi:hypothetical protein
LEETANCEYDYLEIRDGAYGYSTPLAKLCGHDFPRDINSNDRYLFLRFVSDDSIEYSGFRAVYSFKKLPSESSLQLCVQLINKLITYSIYWNKDLMTTLSRKCGTVLDYFSLSFSLYLQLLFNCLFEKRF